MDKAQKRTTKRPETDKGALRNRESVLYFSLPLSKPDAREVGIATEPGHKYETGSVE